MKKSVLIAICVLIAAILLVPVRLQKKDGGSVEYKAILYSVTDVHSFASMEDQMQGKEFYEGIIVEIFGIEVFRNVE